jgi:hypothetical protein
MTDLRRLIDIVTETRLDELHGTNGSSKWPSLEPFSILAQQVGRRVLG